MEHVEIQDLVEFGIIPEFIGRFNSIVTCRELTEGNLIDILTKPRNAIIKQYKQLFKDDGVELVFDDDAIKAIAQRSIKLGTGARSLRMIIERTLQRLMFDIPSEKDIKTVTITSDMILENKPPKITRKVDVA